MPDRPLPKEPLMTAAVAAAKLCMSIKTMMKHVKAGRLRYVSIGTGIRKQYRFTTYMLETFIKNQKVREIPACPSTSTPKAPTTKLNFGSTVILFEALPKPATKKKQKP